VRIARELFIENKAFALMAANPAARRDPAPHRAQ
jgi:hypothetical protein